MQVPHFRQALNCLLLVVNHETWRASSKVRASESADEIAFVSQFAEPSLYARSAKCVGTPHLWVLSCYVIIGFIS